MANSVSAFIPQLWAREGLRILLENMVVGNLVYRDFDKTVASYGETVNTRMPGTFTAVSKGPNDDVTVQDVSATNVTVTLDQHLHSTFQIRDSELAKSFQDLVSLYVVPAAQSIAQRVDKMLLGQMYKFRSNYAGNLNNLTTSTSAGYIVDTRKFMNVNKVPEMGRNVIIGPSTEAVLLKTEQFISAEKVGDAGQALRDAYLGRKYGMDFYMCQNTPEPTVAALTTNDIDHTAGYAAGTTSIDVTSATGITAGQFITIAGDDYPQRVTNVSTNTLTISPGLKRAVTDAAVVKAWNKGAIDLVAGYAAGYYGALTVDGITTAPEPGTMVMFGTSGTSDVYSVISATTTSLTLNRPLSAALANNDVIGFGPSGLYNFAFDNGALALVTRPLPPAMIGALSAVVNYNGLSMRSTITYEHKPQAHMVTLDLLCGTAVLDSARGGVLLG